VTAPKLEPAQPLMPAERASELLDEAIYLRVLHFIDLDGLYAFEQELWGMLHEIGYEDDAVPDLAKALMDRALGRLPDESRRYVEVMPFANRNDSDDTPFGDCELCEEEARINAHKRTKRAASS
jgi:hypothetical protein